MEKISENVKVGSYISFGSYKQDYDDDGEFCAEPIKWLVLDIQGNKALLICGKSKTFV